MYTIEADLTLVDGAFKPGVQVRIEDGGRIAAVGELGDTVTMPLAGRALVPGMVNVHSHGFQRGLRGRTESFGSGDADFWTWREAMYALVEEIDEARLYQLSRAAFGEMLAAGITTVGEFHYLHHGESGARFALDEVVLRAAADAGVRLVLLNAYYATGAIGRPLQGAQQRFATVSLDEYWAQMDRLAGMLDPATQSLGAVAHSVRAVGVDDLVHLHQEANRRVMVFHMHVEEQPAEIEECLRAHGVTPMALLRKRLRLNPSFTAVHCTHTAEADLDDLMEAGANICICPLTEANLGDGLANVPRMMRRGGRVCLGTDSNARISMLEEMRLLEYGQRLAAQRRGVCRDGQGHVAPALWQAATVNGARALALRAGRIRAGDLADLVAIDLTADCLAGWSPETLLAGLVFGAGEEAIGGVCVGGRWLPIPRAGSSRGAAPGPSPTAAGSG